MMKKQWAHDALSALQNGKTATVRPRGFSMKGRIEDGECVTIAPCDDGNLQVGDVVLARVHGKRYSHIVLHLVLQRDGDRFLIGNNFRREDGWIAANAIFGKVIKNLERERRVK